MTRGVGVARSVLVAVLGAGAVAGATFGPQTRALVTGGPVAKAPAEAQPATALVRRTLVCPGPETEGVEGAGAAPGAVSAATRVVVSSAPGGVPGVLAGAAGLLTLDALPGTTPLTSSSANGTAASSDVTGAKAVRAMGTKGQAPTLAGSQTGLVADGPGRALVSTPCVEPVLDGYLVGGGGAPGAQEYLVLTNPNPTPVTVEVTVLGADGLSRNATTGALALPAGSRKVLVVDGIAPGEKLPVVHVAATGGPVGATLRTTWLDGIVARGGDDVVPTSPARATTIAAGALPSTGAVRVRVASPGAPTTADVVVRRPGAAPLTKRVAVPAQGSAEYLASALPAGAYSVEVRAEQPVVAGASLEVAGQGGVTDVAWSAGTPALTATVGLPFADPAGDGAAVLTRSLVLAGGGEVGVVVRDLDDRTTSRRVQLVLGRPVTVDLGTATGVWVVPGAAKEVRAAVTQSLDAAGATLVSVLPIGPRPQSIRPTVVEPAR